MKIVCFLCNLVFCQNQMQVPDNINVVRVSCLGRIDPVTVLETFANGADAVLLAGCKPPDCHYVEGNLQAERATKMLKKLLTLTGLEPERLKLLWVSPLEEKSFNYYTTKFTQEIEKFGVSPLNDENLKPKLMLNLLAAKNAASDFRLRVLLGREKELTEKTNAYGENVPQEEFDKILDEIIETEFIRHKIHLFTKTTPLSVKALAEAINMKPSAVLRHIVNMRRKGMITMDHVEGNTPLYKALEVK